MMYVVCFYWEGERWQEKQKLEGTFAEHLKRAGTVSHDLASKYVNNLYKGVERFASEEFKFICFTNIDLNLNGNIEKRGFPIHSEKGVLPRIYMFSQESGLFGHQVLCLDLDIAVVGSLKPLMDYKGLFCGRGGFGKGWENTIDGDIMSFKAGKEAEDLFWKPFINNIKWVEDYTQGRERQWMRYIAMDWADLWQKVAPGSVISYKRHVRKNRRGEIPKGASIVSFHGYPRPHQVNNSRIRQYWQ